MDSSIIQNQCVCSITIISISSIPFSFSYKKWLNKSKVTDRELPDSRRKQSEDQVQDDEMSSAQAKPRMHSLTLQCRVLFTFVIDYS